MRKILMAPMLALAALSMSACDTVMAGQAPAPLAATQADEHYLADAWLALDFATTAVDALRDSGKLKPGTAKANQVADLLIKAKTSLKAASAIRRGAQSGDYSLVFNEAKVALAQLNALIK